MDPRCVTTVVSSFFNVSSCEGHMSHAAKPQVVSDVLKVRGDGNCFFRSLSLNITGTKTNHQVLRKAVVDYMKEQNEDLPDDYLQKSKMWKERVWATDIEISTAANFLQNDI